jgi:hypothetical protein
MDGKSALALRALAGTSCLSTSRRSGLGGSVGTSANTKIEAAGYIATVVSSLAKSLGILLDGAELKLNAIRGRLAKVLGNVCGEKMLARDRQMEESTRLESLLFLSMAAWVDGSRFSSVDRPFMSRP